MSEALKRPAGGVRGIGLPDGPPAAAFARRSVAILVGYCAAVTVATAVTVAHMLLPTVLPDDGAMGSFHAAIRDLPMMLAGGLALTAYAALPGFMAVVLLAARYRWQSMLRFMAAGAGNVFPSLWLAGSPGAMVGSGAFFVFCCIGGGLAGGFAYWFAAEYPRLRDLNAPAPSGS